jgi:hypothetical protein
MAELTLVFTAISNAEIEVMNPVRALQSLALTNGSNIARVEVEADRRLDEYGIPVQATVRIFTYDFLEEEGHR